LLLLLGRGGPYLEAMASPLKSHGSLRVSVVLVWLWGERMTVEMKGFGRKGGVSVGVWVQVKVGRGFDGVDVDDNDDEDGDQDK
jgi:hypothetical protein